MNKKIIITLVLALFMSSMLVVAPVSAVSEDEISDSIEAGLAWLATKQNADGSWGSGYKTAQTGIAVLKFIDYVKEVPGIDSWTDPDYVYHEVVVDGLNYLFRNAYYVPIGVKTYGDPDTLDNDLGIRFNGFDDYETSIALMAIGATMTPALTVTEPGAINGVSYADVVQDIVDYLSYTQRESVNARGGWGYQGDPNWADNSVSGYASLGLGYAQNFGATIPDFVKDELAHWISIIQSPAGYSYYRPPAVWSDPYGDLLLRTGNLLYQMALVGMPIEDPNVQAALSYIENNWALAGSYYQRVYCMMKGLEAYEIDDEISVGVTGDWYNETASWIVGNQNADGSWPRDPHDYYSPYSMTTAWALLTLEKAVAHVETKVKASVDIKPGSWPNPFNKDAKGVVSIAISGSEGFDVTTIDPASVRLHFNEIVEGGENISAIRWSYEDVATPYPTPNAEEAEGWDENGDGYVDLVLKFSREEITGLTTCEEEDKSYWKLYLTGNLDEDNGGKALEGFDWIRIESAKQKGKNK
jgi:hypothetical protein